MTVLLNILGILAVGAVFRDIQVTALREYDMEFYCNDIISMILDDVHQVRLELDAEELTSGSGVRFPLVCETVVEAWLSWPRLNVVLGETEIPCADGFLELFDGDSTTTIEGLPSKICGTSSNLGTVTTTSMTLRVRFTAFRKSKTDDAFSIVFTAFSQGQECFEHKCANGRCIHKDARCTGYDSCGDGSDCKGRGLSSAAIVGVVVGSLIGLGTLLAALVAFCCCMKGKGTKRQQGSGGGESRAVYMANPPAAQSSQAPPTSYNHPAYGVANQGVTNQGYVTAQQPAFPAHFQCPVYNPLEPTSPPEYSELYPEYTTPTVADQNKPLEASAQPEKVEKAPSEPEITATAPSEHDYTRATTLQVRGINKDFEARGMNQGFDDISPPPEKVEYDNVGVKQDG